MHLVIAYFEECEDIILIETIYQLLAAMKDRGVKEIEPYLGIGHNPTIGDMYEGLTKELMEKAVFRNFDMHVVSGKITNKSGELSRQIDCMIVIGQGDKIPFTDEYIYEINSVIAVVEVKKNLFSSELSSAYDNLKSVVDIATPDKDIRINLLRDAFTGISKTELPEHEQVSELGERLQLLYHSLIVECALPLRVIFGYDGFVDEFSLRSKFIEFISQHGSSAEHKIRGFGATSLPNLIIVKENSLIKTNGMPYAITLDEVEDYCWIASYRRNPMLIFLELLWTRLTYFYDVPTSIFGDSMNEEALAPLLLARGTMNGWNYIPISYSKEQLANMDQDSTWMPTVVSKAEYILLNQLCFEESVPIDEDLVKWARDSSEDINDILTHLNNARLIYDDHGTIKLLTQACQCVIVPGVGYCAADNYDGRLSRGLSRYMQNKRK